MKKRKKIFNVFAFWLKGQKWIHMTWWHNKNKTRCKRTARVNQWWVWKQWDLLWARELFGWPPQYEEEAWVSVHWVYQESCQSSETTQGQLRSSSLNPVPYLMWARPGQVCLGGVLVPGIWLGLGSMDLKPWQMEVASRYQRSSCESHSGKFFLSKCCI